jgi:hypothetical protein
MSGLFVRRGVSTIAIPLSRVKKASAQRAWRVTAVDAAIWLIGAVVWTLTAGVIALTLAGFFGGEL